MDSTDSFNYVLFFKSIGRHFVFLTWYCLFFLDFPSFLLHLWQHFVNSLSPVKSKKEKEVSMPVWYKEHLKEQVWMYISGFRRRSVKSGDILNKILTLVICTQQFNFFSAGNKLLFSKPKCWVQLNGWQLSDRLNFNWW